MINLGANVSLEEVEKLLTEVDFDKDAKLDINEFIALMKLGNNAKFKDEAVKKTYKKILDARKLSPVDFLKYM